MYTFCVNLLYVYYILYNLSLLGNYWVWLNLLELIFEYIYECIANCFKCCLFCETDPFENEMIHLKGFILLINLFVITIKPVVVDIY